MPPKRVFKDEARKDEKRAKLRADAIVTVEAVLGRILSKPSVWDAPDMENIKSMILRIGRDPDNFPLPLGEDGGNTSACSGEPILLTVGIGKALYGRGELDLTDVVLQITAASSENRTARIDGREVSHRVWKLNAIDGDATVITVRLDSTLNSEGAFLTPGAVVHVTSGFPVYMNYGDVYDMQCAVVLRSFRIIGRRPVPESCKGAPTRLSVGAADARGEGVAAADAKNDEGDVVCGEDEGEESGGACGCGGRLCSIHGVSLAVCLSDSVPVKNVSLERVARECVFVNREMNKMAPNQRRFLCYWYYATSVYQFHGKGNCTESPDCIVKDI